MIRFKNNKITNEVFNSANDAKDFVLNGGIKLNNKYVYTIRLSNDSKSVIVFNLNTNKVFKNLKLINI